MNYPIFKAPRLLIAIPLYNEEAILAKNVETLVTFLRRTEFPYAYRIVLVNNASTDDSLTICKALSDSYGEVEYIDLPEKGKGRAVRFAWANAHEELVSFMDADLASDLTFFKDLVDAVHREGHHIAIGNRLGKKSVVESRKFVRKIASHTYNAIMRKLFNTNIPDHQCGFKVMQRDAFMQVAPHLEDNEWFFDTELLVRAVKHGFSIKPVDIVWIDRDASRVTLGQTSRDMLRAAFKLKKRL